MSKKKVVLIKGGMSAEREVSLSTGKGFEQALIELGYPYEVIDAQADLPRQLSAIKADVALIALHGKYAEDGIVQSICEYLKLPYTGCGVLASALCMDKVFTKQILINNQVPTPDYIVVDTTKDLLNSVSNPFDFPVVVKPSREGSSVGVTIVKSKDHWPSALDLAAQHDRYILIEKYIAGMEMTVSILNDKALTPIEIVPKVDFYDYKNKYTAGRTDYILPARLSPQQIEKAKSVALKTFEVCRCRAYGRIDFRVDEKGEMYVMEVNTLPGCTPTSLLPKAAQHDGISFNQLIDTLIQCAGLDYAGVR